MILGLAMPRHAHGIRILMLIGADMTLTIKERLGNELGHMRDGMRAKDDIDVIDVGEQALAIACAMQPPTATTRLPEGEGGRLLQELH